MIKIKKISSLLLGLIIAPTTYSQLTCTQYTVTGPSSSGYNLTQDPACAICGTGTNAPWDGADCAGALVFTAIAPTTSMAMGFTSVNTADFATVSIDGGGVMNIIGTNCGVAGNVIGPYQCGGPYGDVFITVTSTLPFTTVTVLNTGCSSGWVAACPGGIPNAGADDLVNPICSGTTDLDLLLSGADAGGVWAETTTSGQFNTGTGVFNVAGLTPGTYNFTYTVTNCGSTDVANFSVQVGGGGVAGADNSANFCGGSIPTFNLNTLLSGADAGGTWVETTSSGQFNPTTGILNTVGLPGGVYNFTYTLVGILPCPTDVANFSVTISPGPIAAFDYFVNGQSSANGPITACISNPITFDNNSTIPSPGTITINDWDFGNGDGSSLVNPLAYNYSSPGTFIITLTVESALGCTDEISIPIEITNGPTLTITQNDPTCYQFADGSLSINTGGGGPYTYIITNAAGTVLNLGNTNAANNLSTGWYYLNVDDGTACAGTDSVFIDQPDQLDITLNLVQPLCYGVPTGYAFVDTVINYTGNYNNIAYFWNPNPVGLNGIGKDSCLQLGPGDYALTINDQNGCSRVFDFNISYPDSLYFVQLGSDPAYCRMFGYQSGNGVVYAAAAGGTPDYFYGWTNLGTGASTGNTTWGGLNPGTYIVTATDDHGCSIDATIVLDSLNPIADFDATSAQFLTTGVLEGTAVVDVHFVNQSLYFANPNDPNVDTTFFWNFNYDNINWIISQKVEETFDTSYGLGGTYTVCLVALNKNGCSDTLCKDIVIFDPLLFTPVNIFSPDGDGVNDVFTFINYAQAVTEFNCVIVNRWGEVIYEITNINGSWDGNTKKGKPCPDGIYFYTYKGTAENRDTFEGQGTVQIINSK